MSKAKPAGKAQIFLPLTKVDEEQRLVYGRITAEELDKSGEVMDYATSKPLFEKWSAGVSAATNGLSKGNVRVMHQSQVAGKLTELDFNDEDQSIEVCSKIVDDNEWQKVLEGCYTGFSVGGKYAKRWNEGGVKKYTAEPSEVSIVDNPCVTSATFHLIKADGTESDIMFKSADAGNQQEQVEEAPTAGERAAAAAASAQAEFTFTNEQVVAKATEIALAKSDGSTWMDHIPTARDELMKAAPKGEEDAGDDKEGKAGSEADSSEGAADKDAAPADTDKKDGDDKEVKKVTPPGIAQVWKASDGQTFEKKADCEAHEATLTPAVEGEQSLADQLTGALGKVAGTLDHIEQGTSEAVESDDATVLTDIDRFAKAFADLEQRISGDDLAKGMYSVNRFSSLLSDLASLSRTIGKEGVNEGGDDSDKTVSDEIKASVKALGASFIDYATQQVTELLSGIDDPVVVSYCDYYYNAVQVDPENGLAKDAAALLDATKDAVAARRTEIAGELSKLAPAAETVDDDRLEKIVAENTELRKAVEAALPQLTAMAARLEKIENTPLPRAPRNVLEKSGAPAGGPGSVDAQQAKVDAAAELLKNYTPDQIATMLIKASQGQPLHMGGGR